MYDPQLSILLTTDCFAELKRLLDVSVFKRRARIRNPELDPTAVNVIFPILPEPFIFTSVKARSVKARWKSLLSLDKQPVQVIVDHAQIEIGEWP